MTDPRIKQICDLYNHRSTTNPDSNWLQEFAREVLAIAAAAQPSAQVFKVPHEDEGVWRYHVVGATPEAVGLPSAQPLTDYLQSQEFHERCMDYRGASVATAQAAFEALQESIERALTPSTQGEPSS